MRIVYFSHSLVSDWSHGNAHFQRGLLRALARRGHHVVGCERWRSWSADNLYQDRGARPFVQFARLYADLELRVYGGRPRILEEVDALTRGADVVIVHEFNEPELVGAVAAVRRTRGDFIAVFHDTHHRAVSAPEQMHRLNLSPYDGILAYGRALAEVYRTEYGAERVWVFHEAADTTVFRPRAAEKTDDIVWIGNWGDGERTREIREYLVEPARQLPELRFAVYGVRYPDDAIAEIGRVGIEYRDWIANFDVPAAFSRARMTLHIPRGPYLGRLPGIPTIRPFEALACGIPLLCTPWLDSEKLFRAGLDYLPVCGGGEMREQMQRLASDEDACRRLSESGLETIHRAHTCDHRAEQLETIIEEIGAVGTGVGRAGGQPRQGGAL